MTVGGTVSWRALLADACERLTEAGVPSPDTDARRIVECASGINGAELETTLDRPAGQRSVANFDRLLVRRLEGEPLQYVLGSWSFRDLDLFIDRRVLIPRPETEVVVQRALGELDRRRVGARRPLVVDLGTGSGAIAFAIASERRDVEVWATDVSESALEVARANLGGIGRGATQVRLAAGSWFDALPVSLLGRIDLLVSNPPYIADREELPREVADWEPAGALRAGSHGTEALLTIIEGAGRWLAPDAALVLELAPHQANEIARSARAAGLVDVEIGRDLAGRERVLIAHTAGGDDS